MAKKDKTEAPETVKLDMHGQVTVPLDGTEFVLRPSYKAIIACERETGMSLFDLATMASNCRMSLDNIGIVLANLMRAYGEANPNDPLHSSYIAAKAERCAELAMEAGVPRIMIRLSVVLSGALSGGYNAAGELMATGS